MLRRFVLLLAWLAAGPAALAAPALTESLFAVTLTPDGRLVAVGEGGMVLTSDDGATSWSRSTLAANAWLLDVAFADAEHGWAVGRAGAAWSTADGGRTWQPRPSAQGLSLHALWVASPDEVWAAGADGLVLHTADGGRSWREVSRGRDGVIRRLRVENGVASRHDAAGPDAGGREAPTLAADGRRIYRSVALPDGRLVAVGSRGLIARGPPHRLEPLTAVVEPRSRGARFLAASALLLGARYRDDPLGEGPAGKLDRDPRIVADRFDCVTLIEHALALTLAGPGEENALAALDAIRYRAGQVSFPSRHHFFVADWLPYNSWLLDDVTAEVAGGAARPLRRTVDRRGFLRSRGADPAGAGNETLTTLILPLDEVAAVLDRLESGLVVVLIGRRPWLFAAHTGLLVRPSGGSQILLRHASESASRVVDEDFLRYLRRNRGRFPGIKLLRVVD